MADRARLHRSELAVPGTNLRAIEKAASLGADVVFLDLEDAVAPDDKVPARANVIEGLLALKRPCYIELFTDSEYVRKGLSEWMAGWKRNGWQRREKGKLKPVANAELWQRLDELIASHHVKFTRVAGHSGHPENDRCDQLAVEAYQQYR